MAKRKPADRVDPDDEIDAPVPSFEEALARLEEIAEQLEEGKLGLGESLARYEEGVGHLKLCHELLIRAERKIELLAGLDAEGNPITEPFDDSSSTFTDQAQNRGSSRSRGSNPPPEATTPGGSDEVDDEELLF